MESIGIIALAFGGILAGVIAVTVVALIATAMTENRGTRSLFIMVATILGAVDLFFYGYELVLNPESSEDPRLLLFLSALCIGAFVTGLNIWLHWHREQFASIVRYINIALVLFALVSLIGLTSYAISIA